MRKAILITMLAVGAVTAVSTVSSPAQAQYLQCIHGRGCVPATQESYRPDRGPGNGWAVPRLRRDAARPPAPLTLQIGGVLLMGVAKIDDLRGLVPAFAFGLAHPLRRQIAS
jgi:hypothetical protein